MADGGRFCCMGRMCFSRPMATSCSEGIKLCRLGPTPLWWRTWATITGRRCRCWRDEAVEHGLLGNKTRGGEGAAGGAGLHAGGADCCDFSDPAGAGCSCAEGSTESAQGAGGGGYPSREPVCTGDPAVLPEDEYLSGYDRAVGEGDQYPLSAAAVCRSDYGEG